MYGKYICYLLRHHPEAIGLKMDVYGWVEVKELIEKMHEHGKSKIDEEELKKMVETDAKGRYAYNKDYTKIRCCQGHSIPWVIPIIHYDKAVPKYLYHGTTGTALEQIQQSGAIKKMDRHAVHLQTEEMAWKAARRWQRWQLTPIVLKIDAGQMKKDGYLFGISDNGVWCTEEVPVKYIVEVINGNAEGK